MSRSGALCAGPPLAGEDDCHKAARGGTVDLLAQLERVVASVTARFASFGDGAGGNARGRARGLGRRETMAVQAADRYIAARLAGNAAGVLALVAGDVTLTSSRDGRYVGRKAFEGYLAKVPPSGKWEAAEWNKPLKRAEVRGMVKVVFVPIPVVAHFSFDKKGLINAIYVGRR